MASPLEIEYASIGRAQQVMLCLRHAEFLGAFAAAFFCARADGRRH